MVPSCDSLQNYHMQTGMHREGHAKHRANQSGMCTKGASFNDWVLQGAGGWQQARGSWAFC